jgi:peptidyl-prolyl cis-trans isomerase C
MNHSQLFYFKGRVRYLFLALLLASVLLPACSRAAPDGTTTLTPENSSPVANPSPSFVPTFEPVPTQTESPQLPLAVRVNGSGITQEEYTAELSRYQQVVGRELTAEDRQLVMDDLINQTLLAQAALKNGFSLSAAELQERLDRLADQTSSSTLADWLAANGYSEDSFRQQLTRAIEAAWMRDQIVSQVPQTAEQVHARQILLRSAAEAEQVLADLQAGGNFDNLAKAADPLTGGDMGWFPRGFLFSPALEEAAFKLEPGQFSAVIQTLAGFHIISVIEKDPQHPLNPQARLALQEKAVQEWITVERQQSQIEKISP